MKQKSCLIYNDKTTIITVHHPSYQQGKTKLYTLTSLDTYSLTMFTPRGIKFDQYKLSGFDG